MTTTKGNIQAILNTLHDAFKRRDLDTIGRYFADDTRIVTPDGEFLGRQAKIANEQAVFDNFADSEVEVTTTVIDGHEAVEICILHGVATAPPAAGRKVALRFVVHYRFVGELIVFQEIVLDRANLMRQLGLTS